MSRLSKISRGNPPNVFRAPVNVNRWRHCCAPENLAEFVWPCQARSMLAVSLRSETEPVAALHTHAASVAERCDAEPAHLLIMIHPLDVRTRGGLRQFIDRSIEHELDSQGAPPADAELCADPKARLEDQQYRSRLLGYHGMVVDLRNLDAIARSGVLDVDDSHTLAWWLEQSDSALDVRVSDSVLGLCAYPKPVPVWEWLTSRATPQSTTIPVPGPANAAPAESSAVLQDTGELSSEQLAHSFAEAANDAFAQTAEAEPELASDGDASTDGNEEPAQCETPTLVVPPLENSEVELEREDGIREPEHAAIWREALEHADGVQSWENLERLYVGNYLPLAHLASDGRASHTSLGRLREWARDFQRCYQAAFNRLRSGAPRPSMVLDVPQLAFSLMRELEATQIRLILVDGLRFDLGQRVHDKLRLQLLGHANCVQRRVLWAALPATTAVQLELLARGVCALGRTLGDLDERAWLARGADARKLRALRIGPHQIRKLDILEAEFSRSEWVPSELERAAAEVAVATGRYIRQQAAGTLVVVFGDHGLCGSQSSQEGSPEQVLVPYDAWLVHDSANN